jgi:hypothetical protein
VKQLALHRLSFCSANSTAHHDKDDDDDDDDDEVHHKIVGG